MLTDHSWIIIRVGWWVLLFILLSSQEQKIWKNRHRVHRHDFNKLFLIVTPKRITSQGNSVFSQSANKAINIQVTFYVDR